MEAIRSRSDLRPNEAVSDMTRPPQAIMPARSVSLDAYRGLVMLFMASEIMHIPKVLESFENSELARAVADQLEHVEWVGWSLWDLIQPSFMFMVGVAMPYSLASRRAKGQSFQRMFLHALWRSLVLVLLGIFLRSVGRPQTYFTFEDVLTQIGLGYTFLFLLAWTRPWVQFVAALAILFADWAAFAAYPPPGPDFDYQVVGVPDSWPHLEGFAAHWDKNTNLAQPFDQWFLNLFPREKPFVFNSGGYLTLNFVPSLGTMIFGLLAGELLRSKARGIVKFGILVLAGLVCLLAGTALNRLGICPLVKRIWTPTWTIFSTGWTCLFLSAFYAVIDLIGFRAWAYPLVVVGTNSIAMYCLVHLSVVFVESSLQTHFGQHVFEVFGKQFAPLVAGASALIIFWLVLFWMYRRKVFLRI